MKSVCADYPDCVSDGCTGMMQSVGADKVTCYRDRQMLALQEPNNIIE